MVLTKEDRKKIENFVKEQPRNIQEIADKVGKSWRTADRYVKKIADQEGTISYKTFRKGTRGALKIVYWNYTESVNTSRFKEFLYNKIESGRTKDDFSPFDIYQCVDQEDRSAFLERQGSEDPDLKQDLKGALEKAEDKVLVFSGDLSWANIQQDGKSFLDLFSELGDRGVSIRFLGRVDVASLKNAKKLLDVNKRVGHDALSIRHQEHPLRAFVVDDKLARFKEIKSSENDEEDDTFVFYEVFDPGWVSWTEKVFWNLYRAGLPAEKRIKDLESIQNLEVI
ncbi:MAG: hypothetical protein SVV03_01215 [Candidatus Nanohaloarchaea archaeon]|nr:hypothetical protein [Candidatus Nanohaloarchaea archaeon]